MYWKLHPNQDIDLNKEVPLQPHIMRLPLRFFSPAKINVFLRVLKKRSDGYHALASVMQAINIGDILHVGLSHADTFTTTDSNLPTGPSNLVLKAVSLFREKTQLHFPVSIHLEKNIPLQAGLGGGSSNAATTLFALNLLADQPATEDDLLKWSAEIGSDIPFFFSTGTAYCTGKGEEVSSLELPTFPYSFFLTKPSYGCSTADIFRSFDLKGCSSYSPEYLLNRFLDGAPLFINDLEMTAFHCEPRLLDFKAQMQLAGYKDVFMTGSGSSFIGYGLQQKLGIPIQFIKRSKGKWY